MESHRSCGVSWSKLGRDISVELALDPKRRKPDISIANKYLNWEPRCNLEIGLAKTINYFKNRIEKS